MSTSPALFASTSPTKSRPSSALGMHTPPRLASGASADELGVRTGGQGPASAGPSRQGSIDASGSAPGASGVDVRGADRDTKGADTNGNGATRPGTATAAILAKARARVSAASEHGIGPVPGQGVGTGRNGGGGERLGRNGDGQGQGQGAVSPPSRPMPGRSFGAAEHSPETGAGHGGNGVAGRTANLGGSFFGSVSSPPRPASAQSGSVTSLSPPAVGPGQGVEARSPPAGAGSGTGFPFKPQPTRHRSGSSVSVTSLNNLHTKLTSDLNHLNLNNISQISKTNLSNLSNLATGAVGQADREAFLAAADRATTWLSGWAPKGEGRSREFLKGTWSGIGNVAGAVGGAVGDLGRGMQFAGQGQGQGGREGDSRPGSPDSGLVLPASNAEAGMNISGQRVFGAPAAPTAADQGLGAGAMHRTASTPASVGTGPDVAGGRVFGARADAPASSASQVGRRRVLQPANAARLGRGTSSGAVESSEGTHGGQETNSSTAVQRQTLVSSTSSLSLSTSDMPIPRVMSTSPTPTSTRPPAPFPFPENGEGGIQARRSSANADPTPTASSAAPSLGAGLQTRPRAHSRPAMPPSASTSALAPRAAQIGIGGSGMVGAGAAGSAPGSGTSSALSLSASPGNGQYLSSNAAVGPHGSSHLNPNAALANGVSVGAEGEGGAVSNKGKGTGTGTGRYRHGHSNSYSGIPATGTPLAGAPNGAGTTGSNSLGVGSPSTAAGSGAMTAGQNRRAPSFGAVPAPDPSGLAFGAGAAGMRRQASSSSGSFAGAGVTAGVGSPMGPNGHSFMVRSGSTSLSASSRPSYQVHQQRSSNGPSAPSASGYGYAAGTGPGLPRAVTSTSIASNLASAGTPYKVGFQPAGVRADRTAEFGDARKRLGEGREREEGRLGRRWAKLVDLHFNPNTQMPTMRRSDSSSSLDSTSTAATNTAGAGPGASSPSRIVSNPTTRPGPLPLPRSSSSRRSLMASVENLSLRPNAVWKGLKAAAATPQQAEDARKRTEEQGVVKWEEDGTAKRCRICQALFGLSNRKHHCRLCGRVVCSLPPTNPALLAVQMQLFPPSNPDAEIEPGASADPTPGSSSADGALPAGTRREKCSILLVADYKSGRGEEVEEGFVGWMKLDDPSLAPPRGPGTGSGPASGSVTPTKGVASRSVSQTHARTLSRASSIAGSDSTRNTGTNNPMARIRPGQEESSMTRTEPGRGMPSQAPGQGQTQGQTPLPQQPREVQVKGVRVCRECWAVVSRKQKMQDRRRVPGFARLYAALRTMQSEIEEVMLDFEGHMDLLTSHETPPDPPPALLKVHKQSLDLFASFEVLSKRVSSMPAKEGGSQSVVQAAVARSAAVFLAKEMAKVQALPRLQKMIAAEKRKSMRIVETTLSDHLSDSASSSHVRLVDEDTRKGKANRDLAMMLQPLLEQEAQLEQYITDANAQRKYDDGRALTEALNEIKAEIGRVMAGTA